ncbi:MAG: aldehyde ferredoxin oxidoreductase family protein [SAR324 cluster bacterium]|nr:aldehyde ferredoxin oxidoreductase family protein [SAR324 cluster bacterium]
MSKGQGYHGKILRVDLTNARISVEEPSDAVYRRYLGGGGLASYFLLRELAPGVEPLSPDNILIFMTSVIGSGQLSGTNRFSAVAKSPLTDGYGESEAGGYWGPELKATGYDGIIFTGKAEKPVYLYIDSDGAELRDAAHLWGRDSAEVQEKVIEDVGDKRVRVLQTGIAGENLVKFAAIVNECRHFNGRSGMGAVMGSKNLKAVACLGGRRMKPTNMELSKQIFGWFRNTYDQSKDIFHDLGSTRGVLALDAGGILPTDNFRQGTFEQADDISGQKMAATILTKRGTCYACSIACKREVTVEELGVDPKYGGPEYETLAAHGSLLRIGDLKQVALAAQMVNQYVLDSISCGAVIAFAMECYEKGLITTEDTGGIELTWGNHEAAQAMIKLIAHREGIGDLLAEGVMRAAEKIGNGAEAFALHVKGQELPMHEPRGKKGLALAYATSPTGADHMEAPHDPLYSAFNPNTVFLPELGVIEPENPLDLNERKAKVFYRVQRVWSMYNTVGMCDFAAVPLNHISLTKLVEQVRAVTGWDVSLWELLKAGERADAMARIFNVREGFTPEDDKLPDRLFDPMPGPLNGERIDPEDFRKAKDAYYDMAGWDHQTGMPTRARLMDLDLEWTVAQ